MYAAGISMDLLTPERVLGFENIGILPWAYCPDTDDLVDRALACGARLMTCNNPLPALRVVKQRGLHRRTLSEPAE